MVASAGKDFDDLEGFLGHTGSSGGGMLANWKKDGKINVWLNCNRLPRSVWQHPIPTVVQYTDKTTRLAKVDVFNLQHNCHEDEALLIDQRKRDRETGLRNQPPCRCGVCRTNERVFQLVRAGKLHWCEPLFQWSEAAEKVVLHAGGLYGAFTDPKLGEDKIAEMARYGIYQRSAWKENMMAKMHYCFVVVNDGKPIGNQITIEPALLGQCVKKMINASRLSLATSERPDLGNPFKIPYCIQWGHHPEAAQFGDKYSATRIERIQLRPEIEKLIREEPPSIDKAVEPFDPQKIGLNLQAHCLKPELIPWDEWFSGDQQKVGVQVPAWLALAQTPQGGEYHVVNNPAQHAPPPTTTGSTMAVGIPSNQEDRCPVCHKTEQEGCRHVACDACLKPCLDTDTTCPHCGELFGGAQQPVDPYGSKSINKVGQGQVKPSDVNF